MKHRLVIKNGLAVTEEGEKLLDLAVDGEKIACLGERGSLAGEEEVDAAGRLILPGGIDTHVHFEEPGMTDWEDWEHASMAAAKGGITTVADMPVDNLPTTTDAASFRSKRAVAEARSNVDFCLWGGLTRDSLKNLPEMAREGAPGFKAFLADCGGPYFPPADHGTLLEGMKAAAALGKMLTLHCEDQEMVDYYTAYYRSNGKFENRMWSRARPELCEQLAVLQALFLARETGAKVNVAHISCAQAAEMVDREKRAGRPVTAETCAHYLHFDGADVARRGTILKCSPPIRENQKEALWECIREGKIDFVGSDHSPVSRECKAQYADDMDRGWGGISGVQFTLQVLFTDGVRARGLPLVRLAQVFSSNAARTLGLYGTKGALAKGFDADFVIFQPEASQTVASRDYLAKVPISPYIGERFDGAVEATYVRGQCVYRAGAPISPRRHFARMQVTRP